MLCLLLFDFSHFSKPVLKLLQATACTHLADKMLQLKWNYSIEKTLDTPSSQQQQRPQKEMGQPH